jgi:hypothetical protein
VQVLWRDAVAAARRNNGAWSSLGLGPFLGDSLGDILGDSLGEILGDSLGEILGDTLGNILSKYGASLRE